jgi:cell division protein FtsI (penicillin-binding protein 3)
MTDDPWDPYGMFAGGPVRTTSRTERHAGTAPSPSRPRRRPPAPGGAPGRRPPTGGWSPRLVAVPSWPDRRRPAHRRPNPFRRLRVVFVAFTLLFVLVVGRLAQLQVIDRAELEAIGEQQRTRAVGLAADRGSVLDRHGNDLALSLPRPSIYADPTQVEDPAGTAAALAPVVGVPVDVLTRRLSGEGAFAWIARQVDEDVAAAVDDLGLAGIHDVDEQSRFHPGDDLLRSVLGSVNVDSAGRAGLELQYDGILAGEAGEIVVERDPNGRTIPGSRQEVAAARAGDDLVLTIDRGMQYAAERALAAQIERMGGEGGTVVVSDPRTGEILAMATMEVPEQGGPPVPSSNNLALTTVFEPGSVNKVITVAAALEEGLVSPTSVLTVPDRLQVADHEFSDHDPHPTAQWTPTDILATSSNVGTIMLGQELGGDRVDEYLRRFGFGERTALDFPNESPGLLLDPARWSGTSIGSIPIGQGIAVTAMQMLAAYNVIANDGVYVAPRLVLGTIDADGRRHDASPPASERVVSETTARAVRDMMVAVVDAGTGRQAAIDGYRVAGKTGTARKPQDNGTYEDAAGNYHYVTTFAGFVPAQDPQLSIIVVIDEPSASTYASAVSAPVFAELARYGLRQFRIPPPAEPYVSSVPAPTAAEEPIVLDEGPAGPVRGQAAVATTTTTHPPEASLPVGSGDPASG